ncbi:hypothetical protein [Sporosarcina obsidiansis]|uniref:hypothetical protein n=1 Tax=Sporosarcina obsidiansis TaxID=2660748 RepID=UPI00129BB0BF|nr:hypothetical protein [Sporosarcina obsidiansis]
MKLVSKTNLIAFVIKWIGVLIIPIGLIRSVMISRDLQVWAEEFGEIGTSVDFLIFLQPIVIGVLVIGFGELIDITHQISNRLSSSVNKNE